MLTRVRDFSLSSTFIRNLNSHQISSNKSLIKLTSGSKINSAADDAAGLAISERLKVKFRGYHQAMKNIQDVNSLLQTAETGLESSAEILQRMNTLATQSANGTLTNSDRALLQDEFNQLMEQLSTISSNTEFNELELLGPVSKSKADIVFLLDDSGSCKDEINSVVTSLNSWISNLQSSFSDIKIGVITYASNSVVETDLTSDLTTIENAMNGAATVAGGGAAAGGGEFIYDAIDTAINNISWDADYDKFIIGLTDDGAEDEEPPNNIAATRTTVLNDLQTNDIVYSNIDPGGDVTPAAGGWAGGGHGGGPTTTIGATTYNEDQEYDYLTDGTNGIRGTFASISTALSTIKTNIEANATLVMEDPFEFQIGGDIGEQISSVIPFDARPSNLGIASTSISSQSDSETAINDIASAINTVSSARAKIGSILNVMEKRSNFLGISYENTISAYSRIKDTDYSKEMTNFTKSKLLSQVNSDSIMRFTTDTSQIRRLLSTI